MSEKTLNPKQERFCQLYVSKDFFGHGTESYLEAYDLDPKEDYNVARAGASRLLANTDILQRINELMEIAGLNDQFVDKQLQFAILQSADMGAKVRAIAEYNKLKNRITEKIKHSLDESLSEVNISIKR